MGKTGRKRKEKRGFRIESFTKMRMLQKLIFTKHDLNQSLANLHPIYFRKPS
jgi:hypothetical protein